MTASFQSHSSEVRGRRPPSKCSGVDRHLPQTSTASGLNSRTSGTELRNSEGSMLLLMPSDGPNHVDSICVMNVIVPYQANIVASASRRPLHTERTIMSEMTNV